MAFFEQKFCRLVPCTGFFLSVHEIEIIAGVTHSYPHFGGFILPEKNNVHLFSAQSVSPFSPLILFTLTTSTQYTLKNVLVNGFAASAAGGCNTCPAGVQRGLRQQAIVSSWRIKWLKESDWYR